MKTYKTANDTLITATRFTSRNSRDVLDLLFENDLSFAVLSPDQIMIFRGEEKEPLPWFNGDWLCVYQRNVAVMSDAMFSIMVGPELFDTEKFGIGVGVGDAIRISATRNSDGELASDYTAPTT